MRTPQPTRSIPITLCLLALFTLATAAGARTPTGDWQNVKNLAPGTRISVKTNVRLLCVFESATDDVLICDTALIGTSVTNPIPLRCKRARVREVRLEFSDRENAALGAVVGGGIGATLGAVGAGQSTTRGGAAQIGGGLGALIGGIASRNFPIRHGTVIYRR
jgi:hypothetical protein